jgi:hypothetical protein
MVATIVTLLWLAVPSSGAQPAPNVSGHWEGSIAAPGMALAIAVDLARNTKGEPVGTISIPAQDIKGVPLSTVSVDGTAVRFVLQTASGGGPFEGTLAADGRTISGDFIVRGFAVPFSMTRTGEARIESPPTSPAVGKEFEGVWNGTVDLGARQLPLIVKMLNQADGTATGTLIGDGLEVPITMKQEGARLTFECIAVGSSYTGVLNPASAEWAGTWTQGPVTLPLVFRRGSAAAGAR